MTVRGGRLYAIIADVCALANTNGGHAVHRRWPAIPSKPAVGVSNRRGRWRGSWRRRSAARSARRWPARSTRRRRRARRSCASWCRAATIRPMPWTTTRSTSARRPRPGWRCATRSCSSSSGAAHDGRSGRRSPRYRRRRPRCGRGRGARAAADRGGGRGRRGARRRALLHHARPAQRQRGQERDQVLGPPPLALRHHPACQAARGPEPRRRLPGRATWASWASAASASASGSTWRRRRRRDPPVLRRHRGRHPRRVEAAHRQPKASEPAGQA